MEGAAGRTYIGLIHILCQYFSCWLVGVLLPGYVPSG